MNTDCFEHQIKKALFDSLLQIKKKFSSQVVQYEILIATKSNYKSILQNDSLIWAASYVHTEIWSPFFVNRTSYTNMVHWHPIPHVTKMWLYARDRSWYEPITILGMHVPLNKSVNKCVY